MKLVARTFARARSYLLMAAATLSIAGVGSLLDDGVNSVAQPRDSPVGVVDDSAQHITDVRQSPYAAVGRFNGTMTCTAAMVLHPRIIITAGHCIAERKQAPRRHYFSFQPGYQTEPDLGRFEAVVSAVGSLQKLKHQSAHEASTDWAILVLDRAPADVRPFLLSRYSPGVLRSFERKMLLPSYSQDVTGFQSLTIDAGCAVHDSLWGVLVHDCKASLGSSGAPLLIREHQWYAVVGLHSGAMFAADGDGRVTKLIGNSAIGAWTFADALQTLLQRLDRGDDMSGEAAHAY
jgi:protease YdgD